jgi:hypothetical protein
VPSPTAERSLKNPTRAELIAQCLYQRLGQENQQPAIQTALDSLVGESLLGYSEKTGYKIQSSAGQEWVRERDDYNAGTEALNEQARQCLDWLTGDVERRKLDTLTLPWRALFSDDVLALRDHPRDDEAAEQVEDDVQVEEHAALERGQLADVPRPHLIRRRRFQARNRMVARLPMVAAVSHRRALQSSDQRTPC